MPHDSSLVDEEASPGHNESLFLPFWATFTHFCSGACFSSSNRGRGPTLAKLNGHTVANLGAPGKKPAVWVRLDLSFRANPYRLLLFSQPFSVHVMQQGASPLTRPLAKNGTVLGV